MLRLGKKIEVFVVPGVLSGDINLPFVTKILGIGKSHLDKDLILVEVKPEYFRPESKFKGWPLLDDWERFDLLDCKSLDKKVVMLTEDCFNYLLTVQETQELMSD